MREIDVRGKVGEEQGRLLPHASPAGGKGDTGSVAEPAKRKADDEWLELATGDPAFFIKPSDTV
jgi:hypothetical protein